MYRESDCELLSESTQGNTISWEFKCGYNGVDTVSGSITYFGDSFNGVMMYRNDKGNLKIGLSGNRIGNCAESKKKETAEEGSRSEAEKEPEKDPAIEAEIREVWRQYNAALARNDAVSAANYIALRERGGCLETFVALGNKLNQLNNENEEFEIDYIRDGHARAVVIRIEEVLGRKERVGYPVHFYKEDGVWEMDKC